MSEQVLISTEYTLVIDTNRMAQPFAEQLCAFCTGIVSEEASPEDEALAERFYEDFGIDDDKSPKGKVADEKNPLYGYVAQKVNDDVYSPWCIWFNKRYGWDGSDTVELLTESNCDEFEYPAPLSVGIYFNVEPTKEQIDSIKKRSKDFFETVWNVQGRIPVTIEGYRLVVHTKYGKELEL